MERAGPRIYVPLSLPDHASAQPTYAVLEFVGFSSPAPPASAPHVLHPSSALPSPPPAMLCLPPAPSSAASPSFFPLSVTPPIHPLISTPHNSLISAPSQIPISHFPDPNTLYFPTPPHLLVHHPRTLSSSRLDIVNLESPPSSPSSIAPSSASSVSRDSSKDKYPHSSPHFANPMGATSVVSPTGLNKPMVSFSSSPSDAASSLACGPSRPMVPFNSSADGALSKSMVNFSSSECSATGLGKPMASFNSACEGGEVTPTQISVSQTDRETIVHTHSSNFRDVVRQLTGASSDDQDLLPVTLPARLANRVNNANIVQNGNMNTEIIVPAGGTGSGAAGTCVGVGASAGASKDQLGLRKAPLKLHERRKSSMKNLEKVTSAFNFHAATELSPLNPSPVTPLASDFERFCNASTPTSQGSSGLSSPINLISKGRSSLDGSSERRGAGEHQQESGCFYMQRPPPMSARSLPPPGPPEKASPTLLSLFPESPACSPRDR